MTITPKNWVDFQHYKDRAPVWIKLHRNLLDNYEFHCLPVASRALAPMLWLLASEYERGEITANIEVLAFRLRMSSDALADALRPLIDSGFFVASEPLASREQVACLETEKRQRREEADKTADAVSILKAYVFEGEIVKLKKKHFDDWTTAFPNLDLRAELTARDIWLASDRASDEDRRNWFISTSKYLANENAKGKGRSTIARFDAAEEAAYRGLL
jgi:hypothetical protein